MLGRDFNSRGMETCRGSIPPPRRFQTIPQTSPLGPNDTQGWGVASILDGRFESFLKLVPRGLEPRTLQLLAVRSNQLSYETLDETLDFEGC